MEVVTQIVGAIAGYVVGPVERWLCYSFQHGINIQNLENRVKELQGAKNRVQHDVDAALKNAEEIETDLNSWLKKVDEIIQKGREVLIDEVKEKLRSANGKCLNLKQRHQLSRKAKKIVQGVDDDKILEKGKFNRVGQRPPLEGIMTSTNYLNFKSRQSTMVDLLEALKDTNIHMIGVWGMGGIGKTTLVMEVFEQAKCEKLFSEVATADVGQSPNIIRIQGQIADSIGLKLDGETEIGRAKHLKQRLRKDTKILVVLDNIWKRLDMEKIGIPCKESKVILISRDRDLLRQMVIQKEFGLEVLPEEEAWDLVGKTLGNSVEGPELHEIAKKIAGKCAGLPIALVVAFKGLKGKRLQEWKDALRRFEEPTHGSLIGMQSEIYSCIEMSYNRLESEEAKNIFLLCAQSPNVNLDKNILEYFYGLYLYSGRVTLEDARNIVHRQVRYLEDSGLLQDCSLMQYCFRSYEHFHMHDVVRDFAKLTASKDHVMIVVGDGGVIKECPALDVLKRCKALSISGRDIHKHPLQEMEELRVLDCRNVQFLSFSPSAVLYTNLRTLKLDNCVLEDISIIGKFKNLAILSLRKSKIQELPEEIKFLIHLRLLDFSWSLNLEVIPPNVLSELKELEELCMGSTKIKWQVEGVNNERNSASVIELMHLPKLVSLEINIKDASYLPNDLVFPELKRYKIAMGCGPFSYGQCSRILALENISCFHLETRFINLLKNVQNLSLLNLQSANWVPHNLDGKDFQHLKCLQIKNSPEIRDVISLSIARGLLQLEELVIGDCSNLTTIVVKEEGKIEESQITFFPKLRNLKLRNLPKLKSFLSLPNSLATNAEEIIQEGKVDCCMQILHGEVMLPMLDELVLDRIGVEDAQQDDFLPNRLRVLPNRLRVQLTSRFGNLLRLEVNALGNIKYLLSSSSKFMVQLTSLWIKQCKDLEEILLMEDLEIQEELILFPQLEELFLENLPLFKRFCMGSNIKFPSLRKLKVVKCPRMECFMGKSVNSCTDSSGKLISIFQSNMLERFQNLEALWIEDCGSLEQVFDLQGLHVEERHIEIAMQLKELIMCNLPKLRHVWNKDPNGFFSFQNLQQVRANNCQSLKSLFPTSIAIHLTQLEYLSITDCGVEEIVASNEAEQPSDQIAFPQDSFCKLEMIHIDSCKNLTSIFQFNMLERFQNLEKLCVKHCGSLEQVFDLQGLHVEERRSEIAIQLKELSMFNLPKLRHVWNKDPNGFFSFQNLRQVKAISCQSLKSLFPISVAIHLMQLEYLLIVSCGVEEIVARDEVKQPSDQIAFLEDSFCKLDIRSCENLTSIFQSIMLERLQNLEKLWVKDCGSLEQVFDLQGLHVEERHIEIAIQLKELSMCNLPKLRHVWNKDPNGFFSFQNLQQVRANNCQSLKSLFPTSVAIHLTQLEYLFITNCGVEEIVASDEVEQPSDQIAFSQDSFCKLEMIHIGSCENLTSIFQFNMLERFQNLKKLWVEDCGSLEQVFDLQGLHVEERRIEIAIQLKELSMCNLPKLRHVWNKDPNGFYSFQNLRQVKANNCQSLKSLFPTSIAIHLTQLEYLSITNCGVEEIVASNEAEQPSDQNAFPHDSFCKLKMIRVGSCENLTSIFQSHMLERFQNLEKLLVYNCGSLEQVFDLQGLHVEERHIEIAIQLKELSMCNLPKLRHVWNKDLNGFFSFQNLQVRVNNCQSLKSLFATSVARPLTQLENLVITKCGVEEIVAWDEVEQPSDQIASILEEPYVFAELPGLKSSFP